MPSCQFIPGDDRRAPSSTVETEFDAERYINSVIDMFPSAFPPIDDCNYNAHAPRTTLINPYPPSAAEISRATRALAAGNLHVLAMSDNSVDMIRLKPGETTYFPLVDVRLQSVVDNDDVSHSGPMMGVTGSLFVPDIDTVTPESGVRADLKIRLATGPAANSEFGTIYVDPDIDTMHGWAKEGISGDQCRTGPARSFFLLISPGLRCPLWHHRLHLPDKGVRSREVIPRNLIWVIVECQHSALLFGRAVNQRHSYQLDSWNHVVFCIDA
jgi:hypothetical protein